MRFNPFPRDRLIDPYIPLHVHATDDAVLLDGSGGVFAMMEITGTPWEMFDSNGIFRQHLGLNNVWWNIANEALTIYIYQCRGMASADVYPKGKLDIEFARRFDAAYRDNLLDNSLYSNRIFLGIQLRPATFVSEFVEERIVGKPKPTKESTEDLTHHLDEVCALLERSLAAYGPRRLGKRARRYSEICEALAYAMTGMWRQIGITTGRLGDAMFSEDIHIGRETIEYRAPGFSWYGAMFGMRHYLEEAPPGVLDCFLRTSYRHSLVHSYRFLSPQAAQEITRKKRISFHSAKDSTSAQTAAELDQVAAELRGHDVLGDHCMSLLVFADTMKDMRSVATAAWTDFQSCGARVARERGALEAALFSLCPGNGHLRPRPGYVRSTRLTAMAPFRAYPVGHREGYWGEPVMLLRTVSGEPYWFHLHPPGSDAGNVFVTGQIGSGKTLWLGVVITQIGRLGAQVVLWDKDCGLKMLVLELGGTYLELKNPTGLAPLKALTNSEQDIDFLIQLIRGCITADSVKPLTAEEDRRLALGLRRVMTLPPHDRWMEEIRAFLGTDPDGAGARLEKWCWGNELGWVIDNPEDLVSLKAKVVAFDKTYILDHKYAGGPVMSTLYHYTDKLIDGRRLVFASDEFWKDLTMPSFTALIANQLKARSRKGNAPTILLTQEPSNALKSELAAEIRGQCPTHIHFSPGNAAWDDFRDLGRSETEFEIIRNLQPATGWHLISQNRVSVQAQLLMDGLDDYIATISGRTGSVNLFNELLKTGEQQKFHELRRLENIQ